jgi:uncharacterized protein YbbC (DUF1343 family)
MYGHPNMEGRKFEFTPVPNAGSKTPPHSGKLCYGVDLRGVPDKDIWREGVNLEYVIDAYNDLQMGDKFFTPMFEKLIGVGYVREMIKEGRTAKEIEAVWQQELEEYRALRKEYLIYEE